jgi:hypothetical protein
MLMGRVRQIVALVTIELTFIACLRIQVLIGDMAVKITLPCITTIATYPGRLGASQKYGAYCEHVSQTIDDAILSIDENT